MNKTLSIISCFVVTALFCATALSVTYYFTNPIIQDNITSIKNRVLYEMIDTSEIKEETEIIVDDNPHIERIVKVEKHTSEILYFYSLQTSKGYSGTSSFAVLFFQNKVYQYKYINSDEDIKGKNLMQNNAAMNNVVHYSGEKQNDFKDSIQSAAGTSTPITIKAFFATLDYALADVERR